MFFRTAYLGSSKNGVYPMILILPIFEKNRFIFNKIENKKKNKMIDENEEKNFLEFYNHKKNESNLVENNNDNKEDLYIQILKENYYLLFFKVLILSHQQF